MTIENRTYWQEKYQELVGIDSALPVTDHVARKHVRRIEHRAVYQELQGTNINWQTGYTEFDNRIRHRSVVLLDNSQQA